MRTRRTLAITCIVLSLLAAIAFLVIRYGKQLTRVMGKATVQSRLIEHETAVKHRLDPDFKRTGIAWPPQALAIVAIKDQRILRVYARGDGAWTLLREYPILAASGGPGPKLREGDRQVPEGLYRVESLNPNSRYHLAIRVDYPNRDDLDAARLDGRDEATLGDDIMIHGSNLSAGCLAIGDEAIEDVFVLIASTGLKNVEIISTPGAPAARFSSPSSPQWLIERYRRLDARLNEVQHGGP